MNDKCSPGDPLKPKCVEDQNKILAHPREGYQTTSQSNMPGIRFLSFGFRAGMVLFSTIQNPKKPAWPRASHLGSDGGWKRWPSGSGMPEMWKALEGWEREKKYAVDFANKTSTGKNCLKAELLR